MIAKGPFQGDLIQRSTDQYVNLSPIFVIEDLRPDVETGHLQHPAHQ